MPEKPRHVINISEKFSADDEKQVDRAIKFGQIHALHNVRRWLLWWLAAISALFAFVGFFGMEKMISDQVSEEVSVKVDENPIIKILSDVDNQHLVAVLDKVVYDFTNVKDLRIHVRVEYNKDIVDRRDSILFSIRNIDMSKLEGDVAQFRADDTSLVWMGSNGLAYDLRIYPPFRRNIYGEDISEIQTHYLRFRDYIRPDEKFYVYEELKYVQVQIVVNGVAIFDRKIEDLEFTKRESDGRTHLESVYDIGDSLHDPRSALMAAIKGDE